MIKITYDSPRFEIAEKGNGDFVLTELTEGRGHYFYVPRSKYKTLENAREAAKRIIEEERQEKLKYRTIRTHSI